MDFGGAAWVVVDLITVSSASGPMRRIIRDIYLKIAARALRGVRKIRLPMIEVAWKTKSM